MTTATKERVATVTGTFLAPGVSLNGRLYTKENIAKAVARMNAAIEDGTAPAITQLTSHGTDDVLQTVGRFTRVWQLPSGLAKYESAIPDTTNGREMAVLTKHGYVRNVSISGSWLGDVKQQEHEGRAVETADDLEVVRVDYVPRPGVTAARIDDVVLAEGSPLGAWRDEFTADVAIKESDGACASCGHNETAPKEIVTMTEVAKPEEAKPVEAQGLSDADVAKIGAALAAPLAAAIKEAMAPPAPAVTEAAAAPAETVEQLVERKLAEQKAELTKSIVEQYGLPTRTGVVTNGDAPVATKPLYEMTPAEFRKAQGPVADAILREGAVGVTYPGIDHSAR